MKPCPSTIWGAMAIVAIIAANLAAARILGRNHEIILAGIAPTAIALQAVGLLTLQRRGRRRAFGAGFIAGGLVMMASYIWVALDPATYELDPVTGAIIIIPPPGGGSVLPPLVRIH